jgi:hypothetical protein
MLLCSNKKDNMKKQPRSIQSNKITMAAIATCCFAAVIISSCTKSPNGSTTNNATQFVGTWHIVSSTCPTSNGSLEFDAGSSANTLTNSGTVGNPGCVKSITATGTASTNSFVFPPQTFTDGCGLSYTISLSGTISGNTLTFTEIASGAVSANCTATATK